MTNMTHVTFCSSDITTCKQPVLRKKRFDGQADVLYNFIEHLIRNKKPGPDA
jgi:hypothetical protein